MSTQAEMTEQQKTDISNAAAQLYMYAGLTNDICLYYFDKIDLNKENIEEWIGKIEEYMSIIRKTINDSTTTTQ